MLESCSFHQMDMQLVFVLRWICVFSMTKKDELCIIEISQGELAPKCKAWVCGPIPWSLSLKCFIC
jgi:hypothetical protein